MGFLMGFFFKSGIRSKRTIWVAMLGGLPVFCAICLLLFKPWLLEKGASLALLFPQVSYYLFLKFLLPILAVFIGTAIIADEVEEQTLPYLMVRPIPRWKIIFAKAMAGILTIGLILFVSLGLTYSLMVMDGGIGNWISNIPGLLQTGAVLILGLLVYVPFFGFLGGTLRRPLLIGLLFIFVWENTVVSIPSNVKLITVLHYIKVLLPTTKESAADQIKAEIFKLIFQVKETSPFVAIVVLLALSALFFTLLVSLLRLREYRLEKM